MVLASRVQASVAVLAASIGSHHHNIMSLSMSGSSAISIRHDGLPRLRTRTCDKRQCMAWRLACPPTWKSGPASTDRITDGKLVWINNEEYS